MDFIEGVLHRHPKVTYAITNNRVLSIDRLTAKLTMALPIRNTDITVMNKHSESGEFTAGVYNDGFYGGRRISSSTEVEVVFLTNGVRRITLGCVKDSEGICLKR